MSARPVQITNNWSPRDFLYGAGAVGSQIGVFQKPKGSDRNHHYLQSTAISSI